MKEFTKDEPRIISYKLIQKENLTPDGELIGEYLVSFVGNDIEFRELMNKIGENVYDILTGDYNTGMGRDIS